MLYEYKAKDSTGETLAGSIEAISTSSAQQQLRRQGYVLLTISEGRQSRGASSSFGLKRRGRVPKQELLMLTSQLAIMCETGVDLAEALEESAQQATHPVLRKTLVTVHADLSEGMSIADALARHEHIFGPTYVASVAAGEASGRMADILTRMTDILRSEIRLSSMLKTVMAYPAVLSLLSSVVLAVLMFFVLPQFGEIFHEMDVPLPGTTQVLLSISESMRSHTLTWILVTLGVVIGGVRFLTSSRGRKLQDRLSLNVAMLRGVTRALIVGRAFRMIGTMLQCGVPLLEAIRLTRSSVRNSFFRELFSDLEAEVLNGRSIGLALAATPFVPGGAARMVVTAERTGQLGKVMEKVGCFYEDDGERRMQELSKYLEPAIIIGMGVIVAMVVVSILLPMLSMSKMSA